jgi:hypothetical protein
MLVKRLHHHPMVTRKPTEGDGKPGPEPERVKIEGDWEEAVKRALEKKRPPGGWLRPGKKKRAKKGAK